MNTAHYQLASGLTVTATSAGVAWMDTLDVVLRIGADSIGIVAGVLTALVALRALRKKK